MLRLLLTLLLLVATTNVLGQQRSNFVSDASHIIAMYQPTFGQNTPKNQVNAAETFLQTLDAKQSERVRHALRSPERRLWTNLPAPADAGGLRMGDMNEKQIKALCGLMATLLSKQGYMKLRSIMLADDQLLRGGKPRSGFGTENFSVVLFGTPSTIQPWGFQLDGHHVGVNVSMQGEAMTLSPSFIGTQPQSFMIAGKKYRPLTGEIDDAYKLVGSLNREQILQAVLRKKRGFIRVGPGNDGNIPDAKGVPCSSFSPQQRAVLIGLIGQWVNDLPENQAKERMEQLVKEIDQMRFSWNGPLEPNSDVSYYIQGPSLIIEYACQDLGGDPLEHLHSIYRNPTNEYGGQLIDAR